GRIEWEQKIKRDYRLDNDVLIFDADLKDTISLDLPIVISKDNTFLNDIMNLSGIEIREYKKVNWFAYRGLSDIWNYIINGDIIDPRRLGNPGGKRWKCEQCAHTLYNLMNYMERQTQKKVYKNLQEVIAYSVLIRLSPEGKWRHGHWTDIMETHTRFQINGIHLLLNHYEKKKRQIFLNKARLAMDYLISIADRLSDGSIWFLHDDLETSGEKYKMHYKTMKLHTAFGKSKSNTMCLNTHIYTLTALHRLHVIQREEKLLEYFQRGLKAAKTVIQAKPATFIYLAIYSSADFLGKLQLMGLMPVLGERILKFALLRPVISVMQMMFPRLSMPNGFIERDLCDTALSDFYHMQNVKDLLILFQQKEENWIMTEVDRGISYCLETNVVDRLIARDDESIAILVEVLMMYCAISSKMNIETLIKIFFILYDKGYMLSTDIFAYNLVTPDHCSIDIRSDNPSIIPFNISKRHTNSRSVLLVNPLYTDENLQLKIGSTKYTERIYVSSSERGKKLMDKPDIQIGARGWVLLDMTDK
ncbi:MAG TPA: hypothetical protein ENH23_05405, partial [candidate division Zixibacteria bacterium]|nr:hypothetical protein [candidate division Zixibacteria bacterium]